MVNEKCTLDISCDHEVNDIVWSNLLGVSFVTALFVLYVVSFAFGMVACWLWLWWYLCISFTG